jgi:hypothetical protein
MQIRQMRERSQRPTGRPRYADSAAIKANGLPLPLAPVIRMVMAAEGATYAPTAMVSAAGHLPDRQKWEGVSAFPRFCARVIQPAVVSNFAN